MADEIERLLRNFLEKRKNEHLHDNVQRKNKHHHLNKEILEEQYRLFHLLCAC